jgi:hypothetical protein
MGECHLKSYLFVHSSKVSIGIFLIEGNVFQLVKLALVCIYQFISLTCFSINQLFFYSVFLLFYYSILYAIDSVRSASETIYTDTLFFIHSIEYMHPSPHWLFVLDCQNSREKNLSRVPFFHKEFWPSGAGALLSLYHMQHGRWTKFL